MIACISMQAFSVACHINMGITTVDLIWIFLNIHFCRSFEKCLFHFFFLMPYHRFLLQKCFFFFFVCMTVLFGNSDNLVIFPYKNTISLPKGTIFIPWLFFPHQTVSTWFSVLFHNCFWTASECFSSQYNLKLCYIVLNFHLFSHFTLCGKWRKNILTLFLCCGIWN